MTDLLALEFMRNSLIAALLVGASAPLVGVFLVQRGMSLVGDGMGHVALAGVGIGVLTSTSPVLTALVVVVLAAVAIELLRHLGRTGGDLALAVMFYGGLAAGVVIIAKAPAGSANNLQGYLFGALTTVSPSDLVQFAVLAAVVVVTVLVLRDRPGLLGQGRGGLRRSGLERARSETTLLRRLSAFFSIAVQADSKDRSVAAFLVTSVLEAQRHPELSQDGHDPLASSREFVRWAVGAAVDTGELTADVDIDAVVEMLVALMWGMGFYSGYVGTHDRSEAVIAQLELLLANKLFRPVG